MVIGTRIRNRTRRRTPRMRPLRYTRWNAGTARPASKVPTVSMSVPPPAAVFNPSGPENDDTIITAIDAQRGTSASHSAAPSAASSHGDADASTASRAYTPDAENGTDESRAEATGMAAAVSHGSRADDDRTGIEDDRSGIDDKNRTDIDKSRTDDTATDNGDATTGSDATAADDGDAAIGSGNDHHDHDGNDRIDSAENRDNAIVGGNQINGIRNRGGAADVGNGNRESDSGASGHETDDKTNDNETNDSKTGRNASDHDKGRHSEGDHGESDHNESDHNGTDADDTVLSFRHRNIEETADRRDGGVASDGMRPTDDGRRRLGNGTGPVGATTSDIVRFQRMFALMQENIAGVIIGKPTPIRLCLTALFAGGHILLEDVPGTGKTKLATAMADSLQVTCRRIQFTPDLLPSDITGAMVYDQETGRFAFRRGPVFASVVLADEINRASPKTQSALLEVMEEHEVTADGVAHGVPDPFLVVATQNPLDQLGTYRLPEAQVDRFLIRTAVGHPAHERGVDILRRMDSGRSDTVHPLMSGDDVRRLRSSLCGVHIDDQILEYIMTIVESTRHDEHAASGSSMRGALALARCARVWAASDGRSYVVPSDVGDLAVPVLAHRVMPTPEASYAGWSGAAIVEHILEALPVPDFGAHHPEHHDKDTP